VQLESSVKLDTQITGTKTVLTVLETTINST